VCILLVILTCRSFGEVKNLLSVLAFEPGTVQLLAQSLYRQHYPCSKIHMYMLRYLLSVFPIVFWWDAHSSHFSRDSPVF
jgi:hypothetical protein